MIDKTRSDIRLGDLSAVDVGDVPARPARAQPVAAPVPAAAARFPLVPVLAGLVLLLLVVVTWQLFEQRRLGEGLAALEAQARESVQTLETRVASTQTTLKSNDSETQKSLELLQADLRKLDAGQGRLSARLEQQARAQAQDVAELKAVAAELRKLAQASAQADSQQEARLKALADALEQQAARQKTQADALARLERSGELAQLRTELAVLGGSLRESQDDHERRLKAGEQAQASNDAFRRQVNATLDRLTQQVSELYQRR